MATATLPKIVPAPKARSRKRSARARLTLAQARAQLVRDVAAFVAAHPCTKQALFAHLGDEFGSPPRPDGSPDPMTYSPDPSIGIDHRTDEFGDRHVVVYLNDECFRETETKVKTRLRTRGAA